MNLRHLKYFSALAECLHFGKAAERLFMTQPPLSRQIKELETELGVTLFHRDKRNVSLTLQGEFLYAESQKLFGQLEGIKRSIKLIDQGVVGQIRIGYVGAAMHCVLPDLLVGLIKTYPDINTILSELSTEHQVQAIKSGQLDVGFVRTPIHLDDLAVESVYEEKFALVLPKDSQFDKAEPVQLRQMANEPFIAFARECGPALVDSIINICNKCGFSPHIVHETSQINTIIRLVESGLGYAIVPASVQRGYNLQVRFIALEEFEERAHLSMVYRAVDMNPVVRNFVESVTGHDAWQ